MKFGIFSDIHLHKHAYGSKVVDGVNSRLLDGLSVLRQVLDGTKECDAVLFAGDLFHISPVPPEVYNRVLEVLREDADRLILIAGQHDLGKLEIKSEYDVPFKILQDWGASLIDKKHTVRIGDVIVGGQHHRRSGIDYEALPEHVDILMVHGILSGSETESGHVFDDGISGADLRKRCEFLIAGDIHKAYYKEFNRILIPGSTMHINFNDTGPKGYWILDSDDWHAEFYPVEFTELIQIKPGDDTPENAISKEIEEATVWPDDTEVLTEYAKKLGATPDVGLKYVEDARKGSEGVTFSDRVLTRVEGQNFGSYEKFEYSIDGGVSLVLGEVAGSEDQSNGSGKSTLFEIIPWVLWGKTTKGAAADSVIRKGTRECVGTIIFDDGLKVCRSRTTSGKHSLTVYLKDRVIEGLDTGVQKELDTLLGIDFETFQECSYFSQENFVLFSRMSNRDRKGLFSKLLGLGLYDEILASVKEDHKCVEAVMVKVQMEKELSEKRLAEDLIPGVTRLNEEACDLIKQHEKLNLSYQDTTQSEIQVLEEEIQGINSEILETVEDVEESDGEVEANTKIWEANYSTLVDLKAAVRVGEKNVNNLHTKLKRLGVLVGGDECPLCGGEVTEKNQDRLQDAVREEIDHEREKIEALTTKRNDVQVTMDCVDMKRDALRQLVKDGKARRIEWERKKEAAEEKMHQLNEKRRAFEQEDTKLKTLIEEKTKVVAEVKEAIQQAEVAISKMVESLQEVTAKTEELVKWIQIFGPNGFSNVLLETAASMVTKEVNTILYRSDVGFAVNVEVERKEVMTELKIVILTADSEIDYRSLSGGEKQKIDVALLLALLTLLSRRWGLNHGLFGILILDEVISYLDQYSVEVIAEEIKQAPARAVFVVTHITEMQSLFSRIMLVKKEDGISRLEDV